MDKPFTEILAARAASQSDLIVTGSRGEPGIDSVADAIRALGRRALPRMPDVSSPTVVEAHADRGLAVALWSTYARWAPGHHFPIAP
ncbi:MAG: hypothetical protein K9J76_07980 [Polaromonas sp.]|nr:hypothetical protein [Polaromonas sp.]